MLGLFSLLKHLQKCFIRLLNGNSDELLYDLGYLAHRPGESFLELKKRRLINQYLVPTSDYPEAIRSELY